MKFLRLSWWAGFNRKPEPPPDTPDKAAAMSDVPRNRFRIYVAGPYTTPDPEANTLRSLAAGDALLAAGFVPFLPLLSHYWHQVSPKPYEVWMELDLAWLAQCEAVLRLPGESSGADRECVRAGELGIPVFFSLEELLLAEVPRNSS